MRVAVYHTPQYGPSVVFTLPPAGQAPSSAAIPHLTEGQLARARSQWSAKGHALNWEEWADDLPGRLPYFEQWTVEQVPDGLSAVQALSQVRQDAADRNMGLEAQPA